MVKEVEFSNLLELLDNSGPYSTSLGHALFDGWLVDEAKSLNIKVNRDIPSSATALRHLHLFFSNILFEDRMIDYRLLESKAITSDSGYYTFDISKVLAIPRRTAQPKGSTDITIRLFTYEANITTDYGSKRLSVPYSIDANYNFEYAINTDGIYRLIMIDYPLWSALKLYNNGDMVTYNSVLYVKLGSSGSGNPSVNSDWSTSITAEHVLSYAYGVSANPPINSAISDIMISRSAKYTKILDIIQRTGFKPFDDKASAELALLAQTLREKALFDLLDHRPIDAANTLNQLQSLAVPQSTTKVTTTNINYTI